MPFGGAGALVWQQEAQGGPLLRPDLVAERAQADAARRNVDDFDDERFRAPDHLQSNRKAERESGMPPTVLLRATPRHDGISVPVRAVSINAGADFDARARAAAGLLQFAAHRPMGDRGGSEWLGDPNLRAGEQRLTM